MKLKFPNHFNNIEESIKNDITKFIKFQILPKYDVQSILLVGSYAVGNFTEYSDIDIHFITSNKNNDLIKGFEIYKGNKFSYTVLNHTLIKNIIRNQFRINDKSLATVIYNSLVLFDDSNQIDLLKEYCLKILELNFKSISLNKIHSELYSIYNLYNKYISKKENNLISYLIESQILIKSIDLYFKRKEMSVVDPMFLEKILMFSEEEKKEIFSNNHLGEEFLKILNQISVEKNIEVKKQSVFELLKYLFRECGKDIFSFDFKIKLN